MSAIQQLLTDHIGIWTAAETEKKSGRGRASGNAASVYGIKKLRELILELAVRGKLVPQNASDEPASALLKRIQDEKAKLIAVGKIKKDKLLPPITEEERPFKLAHGWAWIRLNDLLRKIGAGSTPLGGKQVYLNDGIPFLRSQNVWDEGLRLDDVAFISPDTHLKMSGTHVCAGDLLFNITGASIGRCAIVPESFETGNVSQHVTIVRSVSKEILQFLHLVLISRHVQQTVMDVQVGVSREGLSIGKLGQFIIPIPPLAEQHRIVAKVDELMALCDQLEARHSNAVDAHEKLVSHLLGTLTQSQSTEDFSANWQRIAAHFDTLFTTEASIDTLKQSLLQLAVMGKLVPQDRHDESGLELSNRIQRSRTGKRKIVMLSEETNPSLENLLPNSWGWTSIDQISADDPSAITDGPFGANLKTEHYVERPGFRVVRLQNVGHGKFRDEHRSYIDGARFEKLMKHQVRAGDLIVAGLIDTSIRCCAVPKDIGNAIVKADCYRLSVHPFVLAGYVLHYLNSVTAHEFAAVHHHGLTLTRIGLGNFRSIPIPLPPLAEQHRIVTKVDELMALCDRLKTRIGESDKLQQKLADVMVEQAVA